MNADHLDYFSQSITWQKTNHSEFPYVANHQGKQMTIRLNDFPEEQLYTLIVNEIALCDFDQWPITWKRSPP